MRSLVTHLVGASLFVSTLALAQDPPPPPPGAPPTAPYGSGAAYGPGPSPVRGYHRHDGGYFRAFLGFGYVNISVDDLDLSAKGPAGIFGLAGGYAVTENLIVYAEAFYDVAINPDIEVGSVTGETEDTSAGNVGVGLGLAYYIMPLNLYISGTIAASQIRVSEDGNDSETDFGPGVSLMIGKEWWVSANWGLGVAGQLFLGKLTDDVDGVDVDYSIVSGGVVFSATYN